MKYLIKHQVINSDHIRQVIYTPNDQKESTCQIDMGTVESWDITLRGKDADRFWEAYSGDAYTVVNP